MAKYELISIIFTATFILSLSISAISMPIINKIGINLEILDFPNKRKHHKGILVRLGGIGIFLGYLIGYLIISFSLKNIDNLNTSQPTTLILISSALFFCIGILDDFYKLKPFTKLFFQFIAGSYLYSAGVNYVGIELIPFQNPNFFLFVIPNFLSYIITVLLIVGLTNGFNWLDGLDGLASGISFILCISLGMIFISTNQFNLALITCALAGSIIGFLRYNIHPATILMGDCGSYLLGGTLSTLSIVGLRQNDYGLQLDNNIENLKFLPIYMILLLFLIPIIDMTQVIISRIKDGQSPFYPDRRHLHHKLLSKGINERNTAIVLYTFTQISCCFALFLFDLKGKIILICLSSIIFYFSILYCFNLKSKINPHYRKK